MIPHTQNTTPNATPITAATTMSRVRHRVSGRVLGVAAPIVVIVPNLRAGVTESAVHRTPGRRSGNGAGLLPSPV
jgi:hypothetical protein